MGPRRTASETRCSGHSYDCESCIRCNTGAFVNNQLLILSQRPDATRVAGYRVWQSLQRHVRKGERSIRILAPIVRKREDEDGDEHLFIAGFRIAHVFDISQTEGADLPKLEMEDPVVPDETLLDHLIEVAASLGLSVSLDGESDTGARGWYSPRDRAITLVEKYSTASKTRTMLHELAHALDPEIETVLDRNERELVAESSAYIVGTRLGIDMDAASVLYVSSWMRENDRLMEMASKVLAVAGQLEGLVRSQLSS